MRRAGARVLRRALVGGPPARQCEAEAAAAIAGAASQPSSAAAWGAAAVPASACGWAGAAGRSFSTAAAATEPGGDAGGGLAGDALAAEALLAALAQEDCASNLTPTAVVEWLGRFIVGQEDAKRAVAVAFRNRWRRHRVQPLELRENISPKNILMIGPTGCGKTEIARRLAQLADAPFVKVEATKFTEVGFHGRDVDSIIRDLVEAAAALVRGKLRARAAAKEAVMREALRAAQEDGIVFIDEIDKIVTPAGTLRHGTDPSSEGVQRDLLPIIEGSSVSTKHGTVRRGGGVLEPLAFF
ncbi:ATP-dependent protease atpase [Raphidocelis subcapitata]|uniref:ATP-dependent protease atpase n=1 Tax=Raphidocelis subcapitata TaxID=307507 RepID=A0A2V0NMM1_9CHLO|nr:ATP-dependent protease atpase [Raphidocelis subcapitata]|eukprot:GBF88761.1 ATP-dependent protease atpase [Raphidocelis subcapitata]